jgi:hypothetical protein
MMSKLHRRNFPARSRGASLIAAVFLITGLAVLGVFLTRVLVTATTETTTEMYSAQALYAAESGIDYAAFGLAQNVGNQAASVAAGTVAGLSLDGAGSPWVTTAVAVLVTPADVNETVYQITSTGAAGGTLASPVAQRTLVVHFKP